MVIFGLVFAENASALSLEFKPEFQGSPVELDKFAFTNGAGQVLSVSRLDLLISDFAMHTASGDWIEKTNFVAYLSLSGGRKKFQIDGLPSAECDRIRFHIGLLPHLNHSNPAQYPAEHALNPNMNGLHWGWAGGYVFLAVEGHFRNADGAESGYSYHLGNDHTLMTVEAPVAISNSTNQRLILKLDLSQVLDEAITAENSSTHSRKGDDFGIGLKQKIERAFSINISNAAQSQRAIGQSAPAEKPSLANLTPYRFSFSEQFPIPALPRDNPLSGEGVELGRKLFNEKLLSVNNSQSCASCHRVEAAFADPQRQFSTGAEGQGGTRNTMSLFNLAWKNLFFWDGRAASLRQQVLMPIQNPIEMNEKLDHVTAKLSGTKDYPAAFAKVYGSPEITSDRMARALEQFLLTLVSCDSKFDRAIRGEEQLDEQEKRGFELFMTEYDPRRGQFGADCFHCHGGPLFQSQTFANNGLDSLSKDLGRGAVTTREADAGKFAVPSLRNVAITAPYMHDGRFKTLEEVIEHYSTGLKRSSTLDPNLAKHPANGLQLSASDKRALVAFLKTLTDPQFQPAKLARNQ
ncbi:MAG TPA: MbnP family protein [Verrucomicrobiae bacterium]